MRVPRHEYDSDYIAIPDGHGSSMLNVDALPDDVQAALTVCREFEAQGAVWPALITDEARAWFRHQDRTR